MKHKAEVSKKKKKNEKELEVIRSEGKKERDS